MLFLGVALSATALAVPSMAGRTESGPVGNYVSSVWPPVASQLSKNVAKASFARAYDTVWPYLHPAYQKAISQSRWRGCQRSHPAAPTGVTIQKIAVVGSSKVPVKLPLIGASSVQAVTLRIQFTSPATSGTQYGLEYTYWIKQNGKWLAVWLPDEYSSYKSGKCYLTPQGPGLY